MEDLLSLAGWPSHYAENRDFLGLFEESVDRIATLALRLHKVIGEDIVSGELKPAIAYPNTSFDEEAMDNSFPDDERLNDKMETDRVCGTTYFGLWRVVGSEVTVLRRPKVVLSSGLTQILNDH